eukprot:7197918-Prymnesium_polylepis.1
MKRVEAVTSDVEPPLPPGPSSASDLADPTPPAGPPPPPLLPDGCASPGGPMRLQGGDWSLFCPDEAPGLVDAHGPAFEELYCRYEAEGRARQVVPAQQL